jgi:hypothetical protein
VEEHTTYICTALTSVPLLTCPISKPTLPVTLTLLTQRQRPSTRHTHPPDSTTTSKPTIMKILTSLTIVMTLMFADGKQKSQTSCFSFALTRACFRHAAKPGSYNELAGTHALVVSPSMVKRQASCASQCVGKLNRWGTEGVSVSFSRATALFSQKLKATPRTGLCQGRHGLYLQRQPMVHLGLHRLSRTDFVG